MALNPSIILAGQPVDVAGSMARGNALAGQTMELQQARALQDLYRTQGAGIIAGDQGALNALAGIDPMAAMGIQDARLGMDATRLNMDATRQRMDMLTREEQRAIEQFKVQASAAEAAAAAAQIEDAVKMGLAIPDAATWDSVMAKQAPELVGQFNNRQSLAMKYMTMAEALKAQQGPDQGDRYKVVGGTLFDLQAEGGPAPVGQGAMQEETIFGPDGKPLIVRGGPGAGVKFTEGQSKDNVYATRANGALQKLESSIDPNNPNGPTFASTLTSRAGRVGEALDGWTLGLSREMMQTPEFQTATTAGDEFLQAILRKDTGAAITPQEQGLYGKTYLPQPGDGDQQLAYKAEARKRAVAAIQAGMSLEQLEVVTAALAMGDTATADRMISDAAGAAPAATPADPTQLSDDDLLRMYGGE